jgi:excisionase family DNA binding protein
MKTLLRVSETAEYLGVSQNSVRNWEIPHLRTPGGHRRYKIEDVVRFRVERMLKETAEPVLLLKV